MVITQTDDHPPRRARVDELGIRIVGQFDDDDFINMQLHPRDTGGSFLEIDQQVGGEDPMGPWSPAGPDWQRGHPHRPRVGDHGGRDAVRRPRRGRVALVRDRRDRPGRGRRRRRRSRWRTPRCASCRSPTAAARASAASTWRARPRAGARRGRRARRAGRRRPRRPRRHALLPPLNPLRSFTCGPTGRSEGQVGWSLWSRREPRRGRACRPAARRRSTRSSTRAMTPSETYVGMCTSNGSPISSILMPTKARITPRPMLR